MLLFLSFLAVALANPEPSLTITVTDSVYEEIYYEEPRVMCSVPCSFEQDTTSIFIEANRKHLSWYKHGKISGIYNDETIGYAYEDCNFKRDPHGCASQNGLWVMRTKISVDESRASINIMIFDESASVIGSSTFTRFKKTRVIERKKVTQQQVPGTPMSISNCNQQSGNCATIPSQTNGQTVNQTEDLEPVVVDIPPTLTARDIGQAMIMAYDSIRD